MFKLALASPAKLKVSDSPIGVDFHHCFDTSDGEHWLLDYSPYHQCALLSSEKILVLGNYPGEINDSTRFEALVAEVNKHWEDWEKQPSLTKGTLSVWACCTEENLVFAKALFREGDPWSRFYFQDQLWVLNFTKRGRAITVDWETQTLTIGELHTLSRVYGVQEPEKLERLWKAYIKTGEPVTGFWLFLCCSLIVMLLFYVFFPDEAEAFEQAFGNRTQRFLKNFGFE
jgi:hypothetical protein